MARRTPAQRLDDLDAAIEAIECGAQSITTSDGRTYTRADYGKLCKEYRQIQASANRADGGGRRVAEF